MRRVRDIASAYPWVAISLAVLILGLGLLAASPVASAWIVGAWAALVAIWQAIGMVRAALRGTFGLDILAVTAIVATLAVGDVWAAIVVVLMLSGGEALEDFAERRARRELTALLDRTPRVAHLEASDGLLHDVEIDRVVPGDVLVIKPGELVPVDAELVDGEALVDESSITGESVPVTKNAGDVLLSGTVNGSGAIRVRARAIAAESQYQQIVALVQAASDSRAPFVRLADRYAVPFTLVAFVIGGVAWWVSGEPSRFAEVLVVATPCPLLIAAPVAFMGGMSRAARAGIILKSGGTLERLARVRSAAFDKTGTLTFGRPELERIARFDSSAAFSDDELLAFAAAAESLSPHVLARSITNAVAEVPAASEVSELPGHGVRARVEGHQVVVGKASFVAEHSRPFEPVALEAGEMSVCVGVDGEPAGQIILRDQIRGNAPAMMSELATLGINHAVMLTGDSATTAHHIASALGISDVRSGLLPADKVAAVQQLAPRPVMMVGDGVNDAPVLSAADVGVAMGASGATAASESADVVILVDDIARVPEAVRISKRTIAIALQSIWLGIAISIGLMLIAAFGVIPAVIGALLQEFVDLVTIVNSLRAAGSLRERHESN